MLLAEVRDETTFQRYRSDRRTRDVVEREFQTAIEACIDIGEMVLSSRERTVPDENAGVFRALRDEGLIQERTADRMVRAAGFRNVLAHQYGTEIDDRDVYNVLEHELDVFGEYLEQVREALELDRSDD